MNISESILRKLIRKELSQLNENENLDISVIVKKLNELDQKVFETQILPLVPDVYGIQDAGVERLVHSQYWKGEGANYWRYKFENAGDILRELGKYKNTFLDPGYIYEKVNKIESFILQVKDKNRLHPDDQYDTVYAENSEIIKKMIDGYSKIPIMSTAQEHAKNLTIELLNNNLIVVVREIAYFNQFRGDRKWLMIANDYKEKIAMLYVENKIPTLTKVIDLLINPVD